MAPDSQALITTLLGIYYKGHDIGPNYSLVSI